MATSKILIDGVGIDLTADTVSANKMLDGTTAHDANGEPVTGNIPAKSSSDLTVSGATVNVPAGYFESPASKSIASGSVTVVTPTVNSSGLVTASANVSAGYVSGNPSPATLQLSTQGAQTITPGLTAQTISSGKYLTGAQTISAITKELLATLDADFVAGNIKKDVDMFGLTGTLETGGGGGTTPAPQKDVNFIDYDGTILYSYTAAEFAALSAMPANPEHSSNIKWAGETIALTSQGWNYTLAKAQAYVAKYGKLWIGQMYIPTDGKTYVCIHLEKGRTSPMLGICPNGTVDVDWGDGTAHNTLTGTSLTTAKWTPTHNYSAAGDYIIKLNVTSGTAQLYGSNTSNQYAYLLRYTSSTDVRNRGYLNSIQSVFVGNAISIGIRAFNTCYSLNAITIPDSVTSISSYAFSTCYSLNAITIPDSVTSIYSYAFGTCYSLNAITIPDSVTSIDSYAFSTCYSLNAITIPDSVTSISSYAFSHCHSLNAITIPDSVTSISSYMFGYCYFLSSITFESVTPLTVSNSNAWKDIPTDCVIRVPAASLDTYKTATNYPNPATYTYIGY